MYIRVLSMYAPNDAVPLLLLWKLLPKAKLLPFSSGGLLSDTALFIALPTESKALRHRMYACMFVFYYYHLWWEGCSQKMSHHYFPMKYYHSHLCIHVRKFMYVCGYICVCMHAYTYMYVCACMHIYTCMYVCTKEDMYLWTASTRRPFFPSSQPTLST